MTQQYYLSEKRIESHNKLRIELNGKNVGMLFTNHTVEGYVIFISAYRLWRQRVWER